MERRESKEGHLGFGGTPSLSNKNIKSHSGGLRQLTHPIYTKKGRREMGGVLGLGGRKESQGVGAALRGRSKNWPSSQRKLEKEESCNSTFQQILDRKKTSKEPQQSGHWVRRGRGGTDSKKRALDSSGRLRVTRQSGSYKPFPGSHRARGREIGRED